MSRTPNVVVIGGGILGASTSEQLARQGARTTWVTDGTLASGASGRSLAWLNSAGRRSDPYHRIRLAGLARWREFAARVPDADAFLRFDGGLTWAGPGESFHDRFRHERSLGYASAWLTPSEVARTVPAVAPEIVAEEGAILSSGEGWVDLPSVIRVLTREFAVYGGVRREDVGTCTPLVEGGRVRGVRTGAGEEIPADAVVLATGAQTPGLLAGLGLELADDSPMACLVFTEPLDHGLRTVLNTPRVAIRPTPDGGLAMDSAWSERAVDVDADGVPHVAEEVITKLLAEASAVLAGHPPLRSARVALGGKPIPGDGDPCFGAIDQVPGLFVAFSHSGATQGLVAGEVIAHEVLTGQVHDLAAAFRPGRLVREMPR
jgi:glycine/D-amino acid oxidase-like deaminating enzyme